MMTSSIESRTCYCHTDFATLAPTRRLGELWLEHYTLKEHHGMGEGRALRIRTMRLRLSGFLLTMSQERSSCTTLSHLCALEGR